MNKHTPGPWTDDSHQPQYEKAVNEVNQRADLARLREVNAELRGALNAAAKVIEKAGYPEVARSFLAKARGQA